jgi:hypothetical protein
MKLYRVSIVAPRERNAKYRIWQFAVMATNAQFAADKAFRHHGDFAESIMVSMVSEVEDEVISTGLRTWSASDLQANVNQAEYYFQYGGREPVF